MNRVLVCEDEDVIRDFIVINLKRAGYEVVDVNCGEDALRVFEQDDGDFDVALLDIMMPGIDGFTVCKKLREKSATMGIIMLSAKAQEMDKVNGLMLGAAHIRAERNKGSVPTAMNLNRHILKFHRNGCFRLLNLQCHCFNLRISHQNLTGKTIGNSLQQIHMILGHEILNQFTDFTIIHRIR